MGGSSKAGYKINPAKEKEYRAAVSAYNRRLATQIKKTPEPLRMLLPKKVSFKALKASAGSPKNLAAEIKHLKKFTAKTMMFETRDGEAQTKQYWADLDAALKAENRRRAKRRKEKQAEEERRNAFRTQAMKEQQPLSDKDIMRMKPERRKELVEGAYRPDWEDPKHVAFQARWLNTLKVNLLIAQMNGQIDTQTIDGAIEAINKFGSMNASDFLSLYEREPNMDFPVVSEPAELAKFIDYIINLANSQ